MKRGDIYICINNDYDISDYNPKFPNDHKLVKYQKYLIVISGYDWEHCYVVSTNDPHGEMIKCKSSKLITISDYRKSLIEDLI